MKIIIDSKTGEVKVNGKKIEEAPSHYKQIAEYSLRLAYQDHFPLSDYEMDCMWMSYRYCIGRHTIASHMHASDIWQNCKGRMSNERALFNAFDINREIEMSLGYMRPNFRFPITSLNRIYTPAVDIVCQFMLDYDIKSIEDFIKYKEINVILSDNEQGYKLETVTWEEWLRPQIHELMKKWWKNDAMSEDYAWNYFNEWKEGKLTCDEGITSEFAKLTKDMPNLEHYYLTDLEDLFVWNDLVHCFDYEHHHKSILVDGTECEWFWSWTNNTELHDDGYYHQTFGYRKIRVPIDKWNGSCSPYIPDESIKENIY